MSSGRRDELEPPASPLPFPQAAFLRRATRSQSASSLRSELVPPTSQPSSGGLPDAGAGGSDDHRTKRRRLSLSQLSPSLASFTLTDPSPGTQTLTTPPLNPSKRLTSLYLFEKCGGASQKQRAEARTRPDIFDDSDLDDFDAPSPVPEPVSDPETSGENQLRRPPPTSRNTRLPLRSLSIQTPTAPSAPAPPTRHSTFSSAASTAPSQFLSPSSSTRRISRRFWPRDDFDHRSETVVSGAEEMEREFSRMGFEDSEISSF